MVIYQGKDSNLMLQIIENFYGHILKDQRMKWQTAKRLLIY